MPFDWNNPDIKTWSYILISSWSFHLFESQRNTITFNSIDSTSEWEKIQIEVIFLNNSTEWSIDVHQWDSVWKVIINLSDNSSPTYSVANLIKLPFLVNNEEYYIALQVNTFSDKTLRIFSYSIYKYGTN